MRRQGANGSNGRQKRKQADPQHALLSLILSSKPVEELVADLEAERWTGRKGYPVATKVAAFIAQYLYNIPTVTGLVGALKDSLELRRACGIQGKQQMPSPHEALLNLPIDMQSPTARTTAMESGRMPDPRGFLGVPEPPDFLGVPEPRELSAQLLQQIWALSPGAG